MKTTECPYLQKKGKYLFRCTCINHIKKDGIYCDHKDVTKCFYYQEWFKWLLLKS
jgi:hypothetical protein